MTSCKHDSPPIIRSWRTVISKPVQIRCPPAVTPNPPLAPEIENLMEVCVGKERRENRALRRSDRRGLHEPVFHDPCLEHPVDQAQAAFISNPLPQKLQQPLVIHRAEEATYVGLYEDVDRLLLEGTSQCVKALVRTPLGT